MVSSTVFCRAALIAILSLITTSSGTSLLSSVSHSAQITNEYDGDGDSYWVSTSRFDPMKNAAYGTITLKKSFYMKMDLTWHGLTREAANRDYEGIMRIGNPSSVVRDCSGHATRYPALYLDRNRKAIQFSLSNDIDCWGVGLLNVSLTDLQIDSVYTLIVQYNASWIYIQANDQILYNEQRLGSTPDDMLYSTASVMISDGLDSPADVTLSDILILSYDDELTMFPTPGPSVAPSNPPSQAPTARPTKKPTASPTTTTLHPTPYPTEPVDFFATQIRIYAEYEVAPADQSKMNLVDESTIEAMVLDLFPPWNITMNSVNIDHHHDSINLNMIVSVNTNNELVILESFLLEEMPLTLEQRMESVYPWMAITDVHSNHIVNPIRLSGSSNLDDSDLMIPWLPFDNHTAIWMIIGAIAVCACSTVMAGCTLWYICKLRRRGKVRSQFRRTGIIVDHQDAKQMSNLSNSANSNSKSGDGYRDEPDTTGTHYNDVHRARNRQRSGDREEVQLMQTDGTFVRRKRYKKKQPIQYERIHSNAEHLDDDGVDLEEDDEEHIAAQFLTPWGPMTGRFDVDDEDLESGDGAVTGGPRGGSGWEFEYDFNIDTFPFHLLPTLTAMYEEEVADGHVTGRGASARGQREDRGHRKQTSTLDVLVEDEVESVRLAGHREMGKKKRKRERKRKTRNYPNSTKDSLECGVEESIVDSQYTEESNLATKSISRSNSSSNEMMYDEGFGRRDTMPDPTSPALRSTTVESTSTDRHYVGGSDESMLSTTH